MTITTLRPSGTTSDAGWSAVPSGTLAAVTSDDNDSTYALWSGSGAGLVLTTPVDSPPAGERRHQVRVRVRGADGDAWWSVILQSGALVAGSSASFDSVPETITGSWGFGAPPDGPLVMSAYVTGQSASLDVIEVYLDMDSRLAPTFTPQVLDGSGASTVTVSDTATPTIHAAAVDLDDLSGRQFRYWVTRAGAIVWDTGIVSGPPSDQVTTPLDNGSYVAHLQIWSTLGANTAYASDEETVSFTVSVGAVPAPDNPSVTPVTGTPFFEISACAPNVTSYDGDVGWIEIQRVDCPEGGYLFLPGSAGALASTPDPGDIPTDLQVTVFAQRSDDWRPTADETLAAWYDTSSDQRGWRLFLDSSGGGDPALIGRPALSWSPDGTAASEIFAEATARAPIDPYGRVHLSAILDVDDGSGWNVTFLTSEDGTTWTQLGDVIADTPASALFAPGVDYTAGAHLAAGVATDRFTGRIYSVEVRDGEAGAVIADPDFTGHMAGTDEFTDASGNDWAIDSPAAITSDQRIVTVAIVGPLVTDECASYVDYSLPRTGIGATCEHQPDPCCSYYRSRLIVRVDGAIQISDFSNVYNPGMPEGLILAWPGTAADIPEGWERTAALDGVYPRGIATSGTQPGTVGGAATHVHSLSAHTHELDHSHTVGGSTSAAVGSVSSHDGVTGTTAIAASHTHTMPASTGTTTLDSGATAPDVFYVANDPDHLEVIWIESDGNPLGAPDGALGLMGDIAPSGWDTYADATDRYLKGAAAGADGGATAAGTLDGHTHTVLDHTHAGTLHTHTGGNTGSVTSNRSLFAGPNNVTWDFTHDHPVTVGNSSTAALDLDGQGESGSAAGNDPPYTGVRVRQNTSGIPDLPIGLICAWRGSLGSIPEHWQLCDGTGGTPDLIGVFPRGATASIGSGGGSADPHSHTSPAHTHATPGHSHPLTVGASTDGTANTSSTVTVSVARGNHTHTSTDTSSTAPTVGESTSGTLQNNTSEPLHEEVAFVQLMETPEPPAAPDTFCLTWDEDEHLVRSEGPDGPLWAPVLGKFAWTRDRPFFSAIGVNGTRFADNAAPGERNLRMTAAVESEAELVRLRAVLERPLVLVSPSDSAEVWAAPVAESVRVVPVGRIRQVTAEFIGTGPQPAPQMADVTS